MKLRLSEAAYNQLYKDRSKKKEPTAEELAAQKAEKEERDKKLQAKLELKRQKVEARDAAFAADTQLQKVYEEVLALRKEVEDYHRRKDSDQNDYRIKVERHEGRVNNLEQRLKGIQREIEIARAELAEVKANVPKSVSNIENVRKALGSKLNDLRSAFTEAEDAWGSPMLSNSAKKKQNKVLKKEVKSLL